jgi:hypothetical protein
MALFCVAEIPVHSVTSCASRRRIVERGVGQQLEMCQRSSSHETSQISRGIRPCERPEVRDFRT